MTDRFFSKLAYREEFAGDTEHSTTAYINVREDASTGSMSKLPLEVEFREKSNVILIANAGSSSLKISVFEIQDKSIKR